MLPPAGEASRRTLLSQPWRSVAGAPGVPSGVVSGLAVKGCPTVSPRRTRFSTSPLVLQLLARLLQVAPVDGCAPRTAYLTVPAFAPAAPSLATVEAMVPDGGAQASSPTTRMRTRTRTPPWRRLPRRHHDMYVSALVVVFASTPCGATSGSCLACSFFITNLR